MNVFGHFGLTANPFSTTPDPMFAYETAEHRLAMIKIAYSVQERMGLFVLQGAVGTGKTTICRFLLQEFTAGEDKDQYRVAYLPNMSMRTEAGFLRAINGALGIEAPFRMADIEAVLVDHLIKESRAGRVVVLMIDEAQNIQSQNLHTIHKLLNQETDKHKLLQIVLFAQPNFARKIEQLPAIKSRVTGAAYLNPLSFEDALGMLRYRVAQVAESEKDADGAFDRIFPDERIHHDIYKAAGGIPRDLCVLCNSAMVNAFGRGRKSVDTESLNAAVADFRSLKFEEKE